MAVMLATTMLGVRRATVTTDGHGTRSATAYGPVQSVRPGRIVAEPDEDGETDGPGVWVLAVDPGLLPLAARDLVVEPSTGREWTVVRAGAKTSAVDSIVNWVKVTGELR